MDVISTAFLILVMPDSSLNWWYKVFVCDLNVNNNDELMICPNQADAVCAIYLYRILSNSYLKQVIDAFIDSSYSMFAPASLFVIDNFPRHYY